MKRFILTTIYALLCTVAFAFNSDDVTMVSYEQRWLDDEGTIALKNNTKEVIRNVTFEITYLDMKDNPLDYEDYTVEIDIEPGKTKKANIEAYEHERMYHYYLTPDDFGHPAFKIKYELKGYNSNLEENSEVLGVSNVTPHGIWSSTGEWIGLAIAFLAVLFCFGIAIGFYILVAVLAKNRHRNVLLWVLLSIIASPIVIAIILIIIGKPNDYYDDAEEIR